MGENDANLLSSLPDDMIFQTLHFLPFFLIGVLVDSESLSHLKQRVYSCIMDHSFLKEREKRCFREILFPDRDGFGLAAGNNLAAPESHEMPPIVSFKQGYPQLFHDLLYFEQNKDKSQFCRQIWEESLQNLAQRLKYQFQDEDYDSFTQLCLKSSNFMEIRLTFESHPTCSFDEQILLQVIRIFPHVVMDYASRDLQSKKGFILNAVRRNFFAIRYVVNEKMKHDIDIVLTAVKNHGCMIHYLPEFYRNHEEIVEIAVTQNVQAFECAGERLRTDRSFLQRLIQKNPRVISFAPVELRNDAELMLIVQSVEHTAVAE